MNGYHQHLKFTFNVMGRRRLLCQMSRRKMLYILSGMKNLFSLLWISKVQNARDADFMKRGLLNPTMCLTSGNSVLMILTLTMVGTFTPKTRSLMRRSCVKSV
ncbi:hypothetical protein M8C21_003074 [Ambrosia artemisiifolia]|uniref:Uncharacterized protein n=1 Tax=Ambrosia artemisiifolia TaxID=4212 RepID=A0AAD5BU82_AMBAR|nr:hypothetical protein M8C21_003074 [Ambrosia artemisiifolia]